MFYYKVVVFAEDNTYLFYDYDDIDATEGVVMYTYFTMKSKGEPGKEPSPGINPPKDEEHLVVAPKSSSDSKEKLTKKKKTTENNLSYKEKKKLTEEESNDNSSKPKTGDDTNLYLLIGLFVLSAISIVVLSIRKRRKN